MDMSENLTDTERENVLAKIDELESATVIDYNKLLEKAKAADDHELVALITEITNDERKHIGNIDAAKAALVPAVAEKEDEGEAEYTDEIRQSVVADIDAELEVATESLEMPRAFGHPATEAMSYEALAPIEDLEVEDVEGIAKVEFEPTGNHYHVMFCDPKSNIDVISVEIAPDGAILNPPELTDYCKDFGNCEASNQALNSPEFEKLLNKVTTHIAGKFAKETEEFNAEV